MIHLDQLTPDYLGWVEIPAEQSAAPIITINISIPRTPMPTEMKFQDPDWNPPARLKTLFEAKPLIYENLRYRVEMRRKQQCINLHEYNSLPFHQGFHPKKPLRLDTSQKPAILIGLHWLEVGGAEKLGLDSVHWALEAGLRVFVVADVPSLQRLQTKLPDSEDVTFIRLDRYLPAPLWPQYIENLIEAENIRIVHIHHCKRLYEALPQIRIKTPWVKVLDSTHIVENMDGGFPRISGVWSNYIHVHHVISRGLINYYRDRFHVLGKVQLGRMLDSEIRGQILPPLNLQTKAPFLNICFIGRLYYQKRPIVLVEMLRTLSVWARKAGVELRGTLVGEGPFLRVMQQLMKRYSLGDRFTLAPADSDVPAILNKSDILLLPSNNEGLALVCYEAIAHGCIPLSTDVGSQKEIIPEELLLPLAPRQTVKAGVQIVDRLWRDSVFLTHMQEALHQTHAKLADDPTAKEVLQQHYRAAAEQAQE